jgi:poly(3-hydroxybutyrate) depolymerase
MMQPSLPDLSPCIQQERLGRPADRSFADRIPAIRFFAVRSLAALLLCALLPLHSYARRQDTGFLNRTITVNGSVYRYIVYLPMDWSSKQKWPVILFLHGSGERGSEGMDQTQIGLPSAVRSHPERWPFVIVMPQVPYNHHHWTDPEMMTMALAALHAEVKEFHGDPQRLYLTGLSLGGYGVWEIAKDYPGQFAAIAPVSGGIFWSYAPARWREPELVDGYVKAIGRTPVWIFHGMADSVVAPAQATIMFQALSAAGADVRLWEYASYRHNAWDRAYADPQLPQWFLAHRLSDIATGKPYAEKRVIPLHPAAIHVDPEIYDAYEGQYADAGTIEMTIARVGNRLMARRRGGDPNELQPETENRFFYQSGSSIRITFERDPSGRVTGILFSDDRHQERWEKIH